MIETIDNKGTTYTIGGDNYYGQWVLPLKSDYIFTDTFGGNASKTYDISSWLPDDNYDYDVQISGYVRTGSTSGYGASVDIITDTGTLKISRQNTRSSSNHTGAGGGILRIPADNRTITVKNYDTHTTGTCGASISMIRRVGKQAELTNGYIDGVSITTPGTPLGYTLYAWKFTNPGSTSTTNYYTKSDTPSAGDILYNSLGQNTGETVYSYEPAYNRIKILFDPDAVAMSATRYTDGDTSTTPTISITTSFGGSNFDGSFTWLANESQVEIGGSNFTMAANSYNTFSLPFLPNDGYDYELIVSGSFNTGSKSGNVVNANIFGGTVNSSNAPNAGFRLCRQVTRTNSSEGCAGSCIVVIPANDRNITVWDSDDNAKSGDCYFNANAYRRIGKNV